MVVAIKIKSWPSRELFAYQDHFCSAVLQRDKGQSVQYACTNFWKLFFCNPGSAFSVGLNMNSSCFACRKKFSSANVEDQEQSDTESSSGNHKNMHKGMENYGQNDNMLDNSPRQVNEDSSEGGRQRHEQSGESTHQWYMIGNDAKNVGANNMSGTDDSHSIGKEHVSDYQYSGELYEGYEGQHYGDYTGYGDEYKKYRTDDTCSYKTGYEDCDYTQYTDETWSNYTGYYTGYC